MQNLFPSENKRFERILFVVLIAYGYLIAQLLENGLWSGFNLTLAAMSGLLIFITYAHFRLKPLNKASLVMLLPPVWLALSFSIFITNYDFCFLCLILLLIAYCALFAYCQSKGISLKGLRFSDVTNAVHAAIVLPFTRLSAKISLLLPERKSSNKWSHVLIGLCISLPLIAILLSLLIGADGYFESAVAQFTENLSEHVFSQAAYLIVAAMIASYLYLFIMGIMWDNRIQSEKEPSKGLHHEIASIVLGAACVLYVVFLSVQFGSLTDLYAATDRSAAYISDFARHGFFNMLWVVTINMLIYIAVGHFVKSKSKTNHILLVTLCVLTLVLIVNAMLRMGLYIRGYGLTLLRVETMWIMVTLFILFLSLIVLKRKPQLGFRAFAIIITLSIMLFSVTNIGHMVTRVNVDRYLSGSLKTFDTEQYDYFAYEAAPALIDLYEKTDDPELKQRIHGLLSANTSFELPVMTKSIQTLMVEAQIKTFLSATR